MADNLDIFRKEFLQANSWAQRKDGVPLDLLDNLTTEELKIAEIELINAANLKDNWPIIGLGYIRSQNALPTLYPLLDKSTDGLKVTIAHSIFQICRDPKMIDVVLEEVPKTTNQYDLIYVIYFLPAFEDERVTAILNSLRGHKEYLIAYNATRAMGLSTDNVVKLFSNK